jgi:hypothetical protein
MEKKLLSSWYHKFGISLLRSGLINKEHQLLLCSTN